LGLEVYHKKNVTGKMQHPRFFQVFDANFGGRNFYLEGANSKNKKILKTKEVFVSKKKHLACGLTLRNDEPTTPHYFHCFCQL
jgi:hypothetical protein